MESDPSDISDDDDSSDSAASVKFTKRVIILLDLDSYEVQVWVKEKRPELEDLDVPIVVVNFDKIILAVNYTARLLGVERGHGRRYLEKMEQKHPQLIVIKTGEMFGKQDCFTPQKRSDEIFQVLLDYQKTLKDCDSIIMERPSKDEVYIDATKLVKLRSKPPWFREALQPPPRNKVDHLTSVIKTHPNVEYNGKPTVIMEGRNGKLHGTTLRYRISEVYPQELVACHADETCLAHGAFIALTIINLIKARTGFDASAGVAHNKLLAKLACGRNKPQGITILPNISIPRVSTKLEFKDVPGYGGKKGDELRTYLAQNVHRDVSTLHDIVTLPLKKLIEALGAVGSKDKVSDAMALRSKCCGQDDSIVTKRHFTDTINASINFRGTHFVRKWKDFKSRVMSLSCDLSNRIEYSIEHWNRPPHSLVVKATVRKRSNVAPRGEHNSMKMDGFIDASTIYGFILRYMKANGLEFGDIEDIKVTASGFKLSSVYETEHIMAVQDLTSQSAASSPEASESEENEDKTMSIEFKGMRRLETSDDLYEELEGFSDDIADQIDVYITTQRSCPNELVVFVSLFGGGGSEIQWTEDNSLGVWMLDLPDSETIQGFIFGYIEENNVEARQIKAVHVTLKGIEEFGSEVTQYGALPTTNGYIRCPYYFPESEDED